MALIKNNFGNVDLLASCIDLDKRLSAIELKVSPPVASKAAPKHDWGTKDATVEPLSK